MKSPLSKKITTLLEEGCKKKIFPGAAAMWGYPGQAEFATSGFLGATRNSTIAVTLDTTYDLASLTKILVTSLLSMILVDRNIIDINRSLSSYVDWNFNHQTQKITLYELLTHQSGFKAWKAFYVEKKFKSYDERRNFIINDILAQPLETKKFIYSDLNFLLLGFFLEDIYQARLNKIFTLEIAKPLGIKNLNFFPKSKLVAPTEDGFRFGGPPSDSYGKIMGSVPLGIPHDDNAAYLNGCAGHAGLFGSAFDLWKLLEGLALNRYKDNLVRASTFESFLGFRDLASGRGLGFDLNSGKGCLAGSGFSLNTIGHLGFTGVSLWWDWDDNFFFILLSNRVHYKQKENLIKSLRQEIAKAIKPL